MRFLHMRLPSSPTISPQKNHRKIQLMWPNNVFYPRTICEPACVPQPGQAARKICFTPHRIGTRIVGAHIRVELYALVEYRCPDRHIGAQHASGIARALLHMLVRAEDDADVHGLETPLRRIGRPAGHRGPGEQRMVLLSIDGLAPLDQPVLVHDHVIIAKDVEIALRDFQSTIARVLSVLALSTAMSFQPPAGASAHTKLSSILGSTAPPLWLEKITDIIGVNHFVQDCRVCSNTLDARDPA